jgi:hypothetical protein
MISRRTFVHLVSWGSVSALVRPAGTVADQAPSSDDLDSSTHPPGEFDYRVTTVSGIIDYTEWRVEGTRDEIVLTWKTSPEHNNDGFSIERQGPDPDASTWTTMDFVEGQETSRSETRTYRYVVAEPAPGVYRFRLGEHHQDGEVQYAREGTVRIDGIMNWEAEKRDENVVLHWETAAEYETDRFAVLHRPPDREEWTPLASVEGQGTPSSATRYRYVASTSSPGVHRFRLNHVREGGRTEYTSPLSVRINGIVDWNAEKTSEGVDLQWRTALPASGWVFVVEHDPPNETDKDWQTLTRIEQPNEEKNDFRYTATDLVPGSHRFRLRSVMDDGTETHTDPMSIDQTMSTAVQLTPPVPNPVSTRATLSFAVRDEQPVTITMYDVLGQEVKTVYRGTPSPEENQVVRFDVSGLASGTYFVRLVAGDHVDTHRCTVVQ